MKKYIARIIIASLLVPFISMADNIIPTLNPWYISSTSTIVTRTPSLSVQIPLLATTSSSNFVTTNASGTLQLSSGGSVGVTSLIGTTNQVNVSNATGTVTLSTPQNIATTSSVTFATTTITQSAIISSLTGILAGLNGLVQSISISSPLSYSTSTATLALTGIVPVANGGTGTTSAPLISTNNLSDLTSSTTAKTNIGLGTTDSPTFSGISIANGTSTNKMTVNELCFSGDGCQTAVNSVGNAVTLYHWNQSSDIAGYERLRLNPNNGTEIAETATSSSGSYGLIDSYISTTTDFSFTSIPAGSWTFHTYADVDSNVGVSNMVMRVYVRNATGTETLLVTATSSEMTTGLKEYQFNGIGLATTTLATDRIVIKVYFWHDTALQRTGTFYYDGLTHYSHVITPFSIAVEGFTRKTVNETITGNWTFNTAPIMNTPLAVASGGTGSTTAIGAMANLGAGLYLPEGTMLNGKIVPSVTSNNLTVALKTLAGTDPSASDPVYVRIGGVVRSITAALSVGPLGSGTNWFNSGSAELATKEIDYFAYLGYTTTDNTVGLFISRIPYSTLGSDFSVTTTNEKAKVAGIGFNTTDIVVNVGRFAATLSAGAGYTWSVPTFTASNLIQRPIFETRWLTMVDTKKKYKFTNDTLTIKGWEFVTGTGAAVTFTKTITFGWTYSELPNITNAQLGFKDSSDPTTIGDFANGGYSNNGQSADTAITAIDFIVAIAKADGTNLENGRRIGHSWVSIGTA